MLPDDGLRYLPAFTTCDDTVFPLSAAAPMAPGLLWLRTMFGFADGPSTPPIESLDTSVRESDNAKRAGERVRTRPKRGRGRSGDARAGHFEDVGCDDMLAGKWHEGELETDIQLHEESA